MLLQIWIVFEEHNKSIGFHGDLIRHLRPDERNVADLIQKAFYWNDAERVTSPELLPKRYKCLKGIYWHPTGVEGLLKLYKNTVDMKWHYLIENGTPINQTNVVKSANNNTLGFILGDTVGLSQIQEQIVSELVSPVLLNLGSQSLLTSHCIVILLYLLDQ